MARLTDLSPKYWHDGTVGHLSFTCPNDRRGVVMAWLVEGEPNPKLKAHGASKLPPDFDTLTVTPSVAGEGQCRHCSGWHGHITNGEVA